MSCHQAIASTAYPCVPSVVAPIAMTRFSVEDGSGRVARVHLTWLGREERLPFPVARIYNGVVAWVADENGPTPNVALPADPGHRPRFLRCRSSAVRGRVR